MGAISREELIELAEAKVSDARVLFGEGRHSNAFYLFGYGVEIGLKACIARQFKTATIPDRNLTNRIFTHKLGDLVNLAGLGQSFEARRRDDVVFAAHFDVVLTWSEEARYEMIDRVRSEAMYAAFDDEEHGVWTWLRERW